VDLQASLRNLTIVAGGSETVGIGGYLTGGGHGALSATFGMGADQVLEMEIVTPGGDILTINECQNQDLFWAMRGVRNFSPRPLVKHCSFSVANFI
jgi:FAD/FMN-containing dehydrogenase